MHFFTGRPEGKQVRRQQSNTRLDVMLLRKNTETSLESGKSGGHVQNSADAQSWRNRSATATPVGPSFQEPGGRGASSSRFAPGEHPVSSEGDGRGSDPSHSHELGLGGSGESKARELHIAREGLRLQDEAPTVVAMRSSGGSSVEGFAGGRSPAGASVGARSPAGHFADRFSYELLPRADPDDDDPPNGELPRLPRPHEDRATFWQVLSSRGSEVLVGMAFQSIVALLVVCNAALIGMETDNRDPYWAEVLDVLEHILLLLFTMELALRILIIGHRPFFNIHGADFLWNAYDSFLVGIGLFDAISDTFAKETTLGEWAEDSDSASAGTVFRLIRLARVLRIFRIFRFFKQLHTLSYGFGLAVVAVFWVSILMCLALYICSILLVRTVADDADDFWRHNYGTIPMAMFTLFQLMVVPDMADYRVRLIGKPLHAVFLSFFVLFGSFGVVALLTGVISEAMFLKNEVKAEVERVERQLSRRQLLDGCNALFDEFVTAGSNVIHKEQLPVMVPRIEELLEMNSLPCSEHDLRDMCDLMDTSGSGGVSKSEFCRSVLHIAENSDDLRPMLMMELHNDNMTFLKRIFANVEVHQDDAKESMEAYLQEALSEQRNARAEMMDCIKQSLKEQLPHLMSLQLSSKPSRNVPPDASAGSSGTSTPTPPTSALLQLQGDVRSLQGDQLALANRVEELISTCRADHKQSQVQELVARRQCMQLESTLDARVTRVEAELRKVCVALDEIRGLAAR